MLRRPEKGRPVAVPARTHNPKIDVPLRSHTRGPQKRSPRLRAVCLVQSFKELLRPPQKGESGCKGKAFSRFPPNIRGTFFQGKGRGTKTPRRPCRKRVQKYAFRAERQTKRGIFFMGKRTFFAPELEYRGLRGTRGAEGKGEGRGIHIYIIYIRRGKGGEKAWGRDVLPVRTRHVAGKLRTCRGRGRDTRRVERKKTRARRAANGKMPNVVHDEPRATSGTASPSKNKGD